MDATFLAAREQCGLEWKCVLNPLTPYFTQIPVLAALPEDVLRKLERSAEQRNYRRRQVVHFPDQPGDFIYILCSGRVKVSRASDQGREVTLLMLEGPHIFGEAGLFDANSSYDLLAETLDDSLIAVLRRGEVLAALQESPTACLELLKLISERRTLAEAQVADLVFSEVPRRIAKLILRLNDGPGAKGQRTGLLTKMKLTHQELANMVGSTRETTTLVLNEFKRQGGIDFIGRRIVVRERSKLEAIIDRSTEIGRK